MTYPKKVSTVRVPDMIEMESHNSSNNYEHEIPTTFRSQNDVTHSLDDDSSSSIVSDYTEDNSTKQFDVILAGNNLPPQESSSNTIFIENSSDILIGNRTNFNGNVVIQNFIAGNEGQNPFVINHNPSTLTEDPRHNAQHTSNRSWLDSLRTYMPWKSKWVSMALVLICVLSVLGGLAVAAYFLYLHYGVYSVAGALFVCKTIDSTVCYVGSSTTSCSNLVSSDGRPFISGHTTSGFCKIYSEKGCQGSNLQIIGENHVSFSFHALSASC